MDQRWVRLWKSSKRRWSIYDLWDPKSYLEKMLLSHVYLALAYCASRSNPTLAPEDLDIIASMIQFVRHRAFNVLSEFDDVKAAQEQHQSPWNRFGCESRCSEDCSWYL